MKNYHIMYAIRFGGFKADDIVKEMEESVGLTDKILVGSKLEHQDGSAGFAFFGFDGIAETDLSHKDWFQFWACLTNTIAEKFGPKDMRGALAAKAFENIKKLYPKDKY